MTAISVTLVNGQKWRRSATLVVSRFLPLSGLLVVANGIGVAGALALGLLIVWSVLEIAAEDEESQRSAADSTEDSGTRRLVLGAHLLSMGGPFVERALVPAPSPPAALIVLGGVCIVLGGVLRVVAVRTLGRFFTAHVRVIDDQRVCGEGIYARVRHPAYVGLMLINLGSSVMCAAPVSLISSFVLSSLALSVRTKVEERALSNRLGNPYLVYAAKTPRWLISLRRPSQ